MTEREKKKALVKWKQPMGVSPKTSASLRRTEVGRHEGQQERVGEEAPEGPGL